MATIILLIIELHLSMQYVVVLPGCQDCGLQTFNPAVPVSLSATTVIILKVGEVRISD